MRRGLPTTLLPAIATSPWRIPLLLCVIFATISREAPAQERRSRNRPILRLKSEFPIGTIRQLHFHHDGNQLWLFSAGDDKVVRRWKFSPGANAPIEAAGQFHWPIFQAERGRIQAMAVTRHPQAGDVVAVGGIGYSPPLVALIPLDNPDSMQTLIDVKTVAQQPVLSLDFGRNAEGRTLLAVGEHLHTPGKPANVLVWDVTNANVPVLVDRFTTTLRSADLIAINPGGSHLVVAGLNASGNGSAVEMWNIAAKARVGNPLSKGAARNGSFFRGGIAWTANNAWVCGSLIGPFPSTFPESHEIFGRSQLVIRDQKAGVNGVELRNSTAGPLSFNLWKDGNRQTPEQSGLVVQPGASQVVGANLPGLFVDLLIGSAPEGDRSLGCAKGTRLDFIADQEVLTLKAVPGAAGSVVVAMKDATGKGRLYRQQVGGSAELLDRNDPGFDLSQDDRIAIHVSSDGRYVAAAGLGEVDGGLPCWQIRVWELATAKLVAEFPPRSSKNLPISGPIQEVAVAAEDHTVAYLRRAGAWQKVTLSGRILPAEKEAPRPPAKGAIVVTKSTKLMDGNKELAAIDAGASFDPFEKSGEWHKVTFQGQDGWVHQGSVIPAETVFRATLRPDVRTSPAAAGTIGRVFLNPSNPQAEPLVVPHPPQLIPRCAARVTWPGNALDLLAVGYDDGILLWNLVANPPRVVRSFYTHESPVSCLAFSIDARLLVTGAADGTLSGWRVDGWQAGNELGVTISGAAVATVSERSPGWEAGFERGQSITRVNLAGVDLTNDRWKTALEQAAPGQRLTVFVARSEQPLITPVNWDPLWTYSLQYDGNWVLWTPQGHLETKATLRPTSGVDIPLEWHLGLLRNRVGGAAGAADDLPAAPRIFDADVFLRMNAESVELAAAAGARGNGNGGGDPPALKMGQVLNRAIQSVSPAPDDTPQFPDVDLQVDSGGGQKPPRITRLIVTAPSQHRIEKTEVWLNSLRLPAGIGGNIPPGNPIDLARTSALRSGENNVVVVTTVRDPAGARHFFRDVRRFSLAAQPAQPKVHYIGFGVAKTIPPQAGLPALLFPGKDVLDVGAALKTALGGRLETSSVFANEAEGAAAPTRKGLLDALKKLASASQPEDVAIIMLAGHGDIREVQEPNQKVKQFVYIAEDGPIPQKDLNDALAALRCRTVLLLDTCHSEGAAGIESQIQEMSRLLPGPLIISSCGRSQKSLEDKRLANGFFTAALKEALTGSAPAAVGPLPALKPATRPLTVASLFEFVARRTPQYLSAMDLEEGTQTPQRIDSLGFPDANRLRLD